MFGPVLDGERGVRLAPVAEEMLSGFSRWFGDTEVTRYLSFSIMFPPAPVVEKEWFDRVARSEKDVVWAILVDERPIGSVGIHGIDWRNRRANTGTVIGEKSEWGKGYASEALRLRTRFAFEEMGLEKLKTTVFAENMGSRRALEKVGYRQYGLARREEWRMGRWHDMWHGEVLRDDWLQAQAAAAPNG